MRGRTQNKYVRVKLTRIAHAFLRRNESFPESTPDLLGDIDWRVNANSDASNPENDFGRTPISLISD